MCSAIPASVGGFVEITIASVGATAFATGMAEDGRRRVVAQPEVGQRLEVGVRIRVPVGSAHDAIIREWDWVDAERRGVVDRDRQQKAAARERAVDAYRAELEDAIALGGLPAPEQEWDSKLRSFLAEIPDRPEPLGSRDCSSEEDRVRLQVEEWVRWAKASRIDRALFDRLLAARFDDGIVYQLGIQGWTPPRTYRGRAGLQRKDVLPADVAACMDSLQRDRAFRAAWPHTGIEPECVWSEDVDALHDFLELPSRRYFVIARLVDDPVFWAVDSEDPSGNLIELTWQDGQREPRSGPGSFTDLVSERLLLLEELEDDASEAERDAIAALKRWIAERAA